MEKRKQWAAVIAGVMLFSLSACSKQAPTETDPPAESVAPSSSTEYANLETVEGEGLIVEGPTSNEAPQEADYTVIFEEVYNDVKDNFNSAYFGMTDFELELEFLTPKIYDHELPENGKDLYTEWRLANHPLTDEEKPADTQKPVETTKPSTGNNQSSGQNTQKPSGGQQSNTQKPTNNQPPSGGGNTPPSGGGTTGPVDSDGWSISDPGYRGEDNRTDEEKRQGIEDSYNVKNPIDSITG